MRKITYTNLVNGLSAEFSSDSPTMHLKLSGFDGNSVASNAIAYTPVGLDGQKTVSCKLSPRTIVVPVEFTAKVGERYSRSGALAIWQKLQKVFVPLHEGWLVWSDGTNSRRIKCRTSETPKLTEILPYLFTASFTLIADYPYWESCTEHNIAVTAGTSHISIMNDCGLEVPICVDVPGDCLNAFILMSDTAGEGLAFGSKIEQGFTIDTKECTVTLADGTLANHLLTVNSSFFKLKPGSNVLRAIGLGSGNAAVRWRELYMGVD